MTPSWYDVLGVDPAADTDTIRAAWRSAVADLDPTDRRFRALNAAAEVLLDDERRRAHDKELAAQAAAEQPVDEEPVEEEPAPPTPPSEMDGGADVAVPLAPEKPRPPRASRRPGTALTAALGVLAGLLLVGSLLLVTGDDDGATTASGGDLPDAQEVAAAREAAEAAAVPVLSYDYRVLEESKQAALSYLTPDYAEEYEQLFESIIAVNAPSTQTVVEAEVQASGVVRTGPGLVDVLLFVDRPTVNREQTTPEVYKDQATLRMREIAGDWLVDCVISGAGSTCEE
jgi:Mce-associated membrane protein